MDGASPEGREEVVAGNVEGHAELEQLLRERLACSRASGNSIWPAMKCGEREVS